MNGKTADDVELKKKQKNCLILLLKIKTVYFINKTLLIKLENLFIQKAEYL